MVSELIDEVIVSLSIAFKIGAIHIALAFLLDLLIGDPRWIPHHVRIIGWAINRTERILRRFFKGRAERVGGALLVFIIVGSTFIVSVAIVRILSPVPGGEATTLTIIDFLSLCLFVLLASQTIAVRGLVDSVREVIKKVEEKDMISARMSLSRIVGRDTGNLDEEGVLRAGLESLSENLSDGVVAPLFYLTIGGLPLAMTYKAINTLDSMVGYKDERYRLFGWFAARLDDIVNYIPARISALLILLATFFYYTAYHVSLIFIDLIKKDRPLRRLFLLFTVFMYDFIMLVWKSIKLGFLFAERSYLVIVRDGRNHPSPNSGYPEAALAGALGVRFGGPSTYGGRVVEKPYIGVSTRPLNLEVSYEGLMIVEIAALLAGGIAVAVRI